MDQSIGAEQTSSIRTIKRLSSPEFCNNQPGHQQQQQFHQHQSISQHSSLHSSQISSHSQASQKHQQPLYNVNQQTSQNFNKNDIDFSSDAIKGQSTAGSITGQEHPNTNSDPKHLDLKNHPQPITAFSPQQFSLPETNSIKTQSPGLLDMPTF